MIDLHAHYPMHLVPSTRGKVWTVLRTVPGRRALRDRLRARLVGLASLAINHRTVCSGPRVRVSSMRAGEVEVALSVLYSFFDEFAGVVGDPMPGQRSRQNIEDQLRVVEAHVARKHAATVVIARSPGDLETARAAGKLALVHCVEGGFQLGATPQAVTEGVARLAELGVAYVTLAHLIWRGVATDAPALPFLTDAQYRRWFPQPNEGLSPLGRAAVRAMVAHGVLIDVAHMSERALADTFALLDELDPSRTVPVLASHSGYRFGDQEYLLSAATIERIAERDGVIGLIFASHQLSDGLTPGHPALTPAERRRHGLEILCAHIDAIARVTGSHRHTAIGSDLDGFIKPTLPGLGDMRDMRRLAAALTARYGAADAHAIGTGNALRVLRHWTRGVAVPTEAAPPGA